MGEGQNSESPPVLSSYVASSFRERPNSRSSGFRQVAEPNTLVWSPMAKSPPPCLTNSLMAAISDFVNGVEGTLRINTLQSANASEESGPSSWRTFR